MVLTVWTVHTLKSVLLYHNLPTIGTNKQLVLRTYLLRCNRIADVVARQECQRNDLTNITQKVILEQRWLSFTSHIYRTRKYYPRTKSSQYLTTSTFNIREEIKVLSILRPPQYKDIRECTAVELQEWGNRLAPKWNKLDSVWIRKHRLER